jgi:uncharacterized protein (TIGR02271 family)
MDQTQTYADNQTVVGYFDNPDQADRALSALQSAGFTSAHLGMAHRGGSSGRNAAGSAAHKTENAAHNMWEKVKDFFEGNSPENYADERTRGDAGTREITDPDSTSSSNTSTRSGYDRDDLHHSLTGMRVPEHRSRYFNQRFGSSSNGAIVTVNAGPRASEAERILRENGADLGDTASESADYATPAAGTYAAREGYDDTRRDQPTSQYNAPESTSESTREYTGQAANTSYDDRNLNRAEDMQNIQLLGEVLRVHKDRLTRGEVVVRKDVITETQTVQVPVTREELVVEQRDAAGDTPARGNIGDNQEIRIPLTEETASVDKGTVVRQEVAVGKKPVQEVRDLSGEVRREELVVDDRATKRAVNE